MGENKNVEMCYLDDEAVAMSLLFAPDLASTGGTEVYVIGDVELYGRCLNRFNSK